jgi:hypothetical protein
MRKEHETDRPAVLHYVLAVNFSRFFTIAIQREEPTMPLRIKHWLQGCAQQVETTALPAGGASPCSAAVFSPFCRYQ